MTEKLSRESSFNKVGSRTYSIDVYVTKIHDKNPNGGGSLSLMRRKFEVKANHIPFNEYLNGKLFTLHSSAWGQFELPDIDDWCELRFPYYGRGVEEECFHRGVLVPSETSKRRNYSPIQSSLKDDDILPFDEVSPLSVYGTNDIIKELIRRGCKGEISLTTTYTL